MTFAGIEVFFKKPCVVPAVFIKDVRVNLCNHGGLGVSGVTLDRLYISAVQLQFVGDAGMTQAVENDFRKIMLVDQLCKSLLND